jgi:hypothetical protein
MSWSDDRNCFKNDLTITDRRKKLQGEVFELRAEVSESYEQFVGIIFTSVGFHAPGYKVISEQLTDGLSGIDQMNMLTKHPSNGLFEQRIVRAPQNNGVHILCF